MTMLDTADLIERTHRVPALPPAEGVQNGPTAQMIARQLDAALLSVGFTCSGALIDNLAAADAAAAMDHAVTVLAAARKLVGDHVAHNSYFRDFPLGVPATEQFWAECLRDAILRGTTGEQARAVVNGGWDTTVFNLLDLPIYGRYQHTFAELAAAHDELVALAGDRLTTLQLGGAPEAECARLLAELAGSTTPLTDGQRGVLAALVAGPVDVGVITDVPVAENRAIIGAAQLAADQPVTVARTVTDVLRVAAAASGADVTLQHAPRFVSLRRSSRRALLAALDRIVKANKATLNDVAAHAEVWKRLGERLHAEQYVARYPGAALVFTVARRDEGVWRSPVSRAEAVALDRPGEAAQVLGETMPGVLARWTDRLLRVCLPGSEDYAAVLREFELAAPRMSGRVLLSLRDHLANRAQRSGRRIFVGRGGRARAFDDTRPTLAPEAIKAVSAIIDAEISERLPTVNRLVLDPDVFDVALPLSGKATADGFAILPRGSSMPLPAGDSLRMFCYWRQAEGQTDFDLSLLMLDEQFEDAGHVSWTRLGSRDGVVHSGDIVTAADGATEFIDIPLATVKAAYLVPQVNVYSGEGFDEVAESLVGWMVRDRAQAGMPFEARTVRARSELRGEGRVALPMAFHRGPDGRGGAWWVTWMHLNLPGRPYLNAVENNRVSTSELARGIVGRRYLTVRYLAELLAAKARMTFRDSAMPTGGPVTYVGMQRPDGLPEGSTVITLENLATLIPA